MEEDFKFKVVVWDSQILNMGPRRFELRTSRLSVVRSTRLSHGPSNRRTLSGFIYFFVKKRRKSAVNPIL